MQILMKPASLSRLELLAKRKKKSFSL